MQRGKDITTVFSCRVGKAVTEAEAQDMIAHADRDGDGTVSFAEFVRFSSGADMKGSKIPKPVR